MKTVDLKDVTGGKCWWLVTNKPSYVIQSRFGWFVIPQGMILLKYAYLNFLNFKTRKYRTEL